MRVDLVAIDLDLVRIDLVAIDLDLVRIDLVTPSQNCINNEDYIQQYKNKQQNEYYCCLASSTFFGIFGR